jgi:hypothetical protein
MNNLQNSASRRFYTSTNWSNKGKPQSKTRHQGHIATMITRVATASRYIPSILMAMDLWRIGKEILGHLHNKEAKDPPSNDQTTSITEGACQVEATVGTEGRTHLNLHTTCFTTARQTIAQKVAPSSSSTKERWSKIPASLCNNRHLKK